MRACIDATGTRTCIFRIGGLIELQSSLSINNPYITIAGQTAPGGGITLTMKRINGITNARDVLLIKTHDVILRYISSRPGAGGSNHGTQIASEGKDLYNIMIDHCSFSWGVDSNIETWYRVYDTTLQWSIISEALDCSTHPKGCHSKGLMIGGFSGKENSYTKGSEDISVHHNLIAHAGERLPLLQICGIAQIINNVSYNPYWTFAHQQNNCPGYVSYVNWIGNYHKKGPDSTSNTDLKVIQADSGDKPGGGTKIYVQGNIGPSRTKNNLPENDWVEKGSRSYIVTEPAPGPSITTTDAFTAYSNVLADAGNNAGLRCNGTWRIRRDSIDTRVVNEVTNGTGHIIDDPSDVGGWITPARGVACTDSDHDGMPDIWEDKYGLNKNTFSDTNGDKDGDGYTNLEEYLNGTNPIEGLTKTMTIMSNATQDGWLLESGEDTNRGGARDSTNTTFKIGDDNLDRQYRAILSFNTAGLPDNATITKVNIKIRKQGLVGTDPFTTHGGMKVDIRKPFFGTTSGLVSSDFQATPGQSDVASFGPIPVSNWYSALLNANGRTYINLTGTTQVRLRFTIDDNDDMGSDYMRFFSGNYANTIYRPNLIIEYTIP
ncbi:MAG: hypothetical protein ABIJ16_08055 [Bacteroidota bacterium]